MSDEHRTDTGYRLERRQIIRRPRAEVFEFFSRAENLQAITPDFLHFHVRTPLPIVLREGTLIEYRLRLYGVPFVWRSRIESFQAPERFVDVQVRGPYARWTHLHEFRAHRGDPPRASGEEATEMLDRVDYALPLGRWMRPVHALLVRRSLARIFDYRRDRIREILEGRSPRGEGTPP
jgi:ligand-binding SRPBCC domain-containing protein